MDQDLKTELKWLAIGGGALILFLMLMVGLAGREEKKIAYDECQSFCTACNSEIRLFDEGVCICKEAKKK